MADGTEKGFSVQHERGYSAGEIDMRNIAYSVSRILTEVVP